MNKMQEQCNRFHAGKSVDAYRFMGYHPVRTNGKSGYVFRVFAPHAKSIAVVGDFNFWNPEDTPMKKISPGIWEAFSYVAKKNQCYKYYIKRADGAYAYKTDPYGFACEALPGTSTQIVDLDFVWTDSKWRQTVSRKKPFSQPINIYEVHLGSWKKKEDGSYYSYAELADELMPYVKSMGYTHIELLPIGEYPYSPSWGYQVTGYYAPTFRYGTPLEFKRFINACHNAGIGVIIDWVAAHFPKDANGLYEFDGTCLYETDHPLMREHPEWGTRIFDYSRPEVKSFLISNALFWMKEYHVDGIRADAVASILYLDYARREYIPNHLGGNLNLDAIAFLRQLNEAAFAANPSILMIAEESTTFPLVTKPGYDGGLGFGFKWNMGWMNDILDYMSTAPPYRKSKHNKLTFSLTYAFSENFILPLSHDEVVHGKKSLINKMPGEYADKFASLRTLYGFMMAHPGKKLSFMGNEFAQFIEWNDQQGLDWLLLGYEMHQKMHAYVKDLNHFYLENAPLWQIDDSWKGFQWISPNDRDNSVIAFYRQDKKGKLLLCIGNFFPEKREHYRIGLPRRGCYIPVFSGDDMKYGGNGTPLTPVKSEQKPFHGLMFSGEFTLPPMAMVFYKITG